MVISSPEGKVGFVKSDEHAWCCQMGNVSCIRGLSVFGFVKPSVRAVVKVSPLEGRRIICTLNGVVQDFRDGVSLFDIERGTALPCIVDELECTDGAADCFSD